MSRRSFYTLLIVAIAALLAGGLFSRWIVVERGLSGPQLKSRIEAEASRVLQRSVTIESIDWHRWPHWNVVGRNVRLWSDTSHHRLLFEMPSVEVHLTLLS